MPESTLKLTSILKAEKVKLIHKRRVTKITKSGNNVKNLELRISRQGFEVAKERLQKWTIKRTTHAPPAQWPLRGPRITWTLHPEKQGSIATLRAYNQPHNL
jgi:hypothetical protein